MLHAFYFLDERGVDGVVGDCDVYEEGWRMSDLWRIGGEVRVVFSF